jgi:RNA polymerase sigma factor (sigma-70 family)
MVAGEKWGQKDRQTNVCPTVRMTSPDNRREWVLAALAQFEGRLTRYAQRLTGDLDQARDVVQFVFLRLCDQSEEGIGDRLAQWLYTVCRNRAMDALRSSGREKANGVAVGHEVDHGKPGLPYGHSHSPRDRRGGQSPPYSREIDPADTAQQAELHALLRELIEELPSNQREALDLWGDGFNYRQIAAIIDREEGHVRVLVHRGLKALREHPRVRAVIEEDCETSSRIASRASGVTSEPTP